KQDFAVANTGETRLSILKGDGAGGFGNLLAPRAGTTPYAVAVGDLDADGKQDLAVANFGSNNLNILLGNGNGAFADALLSPISDGSRPPAVTVAGFNAAGRPHAAAAHTSTG